MNWIKEKLEKAQMAIIVSGIIVVGGFFYSMYIGDMEMVKYFAGFGLGFLFGATAANG